jgi:hypothetical protein
MACDRLPATLAGRTRRHGQIRLNYGAPHHFKMQSQSMFVTKHVYTGT